MLKNIRHFIPAVLFLILSIVGTYATATVHSVTMKSISYDPKSITIKPGDEIEWINKSYSEHSATSEQFDTGTVAPQKTSKKLEFKNIGTFSYHCSVHGKTMSGQVVVSK